ncbi:hypothetical protein SISNIDRAFT_549490 [Sistotremastrum niveocremeum HHB9708]|uniref:Uncharacterized protein n=1 Tax=Sistotremastrum niveocremeum HHB9708 TaxID=1314777 RepID=A0A164UZA0_9AGAM|nr:hypothetical protein SISNIDRAFT_549490 [Sistotremastrum niveocremeum HHB9708]
MSGTHSFEDLVDAVRVSAQSTIKKVSRGALESFSVDVALVALGIRSGFLIDTFSPWFEEMTVFIETLQSKSRHFESLALLTDDDSSNHFIPWTSFIFLAKDLSTPPLHSFVYDQLQISSQSRPSPTVMNHIRAITDQDTHPFMPPTRLCTKDAISLAGFLLEYPFSYRPSDLSVNSNPLGGVPLLLYECSLVSSTSSTPSLMKFSFPLQLSIDVPSFASDIIQECLLERFRKRLSESPVLLPWTDVDVTFIPITLNHVAL